MNLRSIFLISAAVLTAGNGYAQGTTKKKVKVFTTAKNTELRKRTLSGTGYYGANELFLTLTKDENWQATDGKTGTVEEYRDKETGRC